MKNHWIEITLRLDGGVAGVAEAAADVVSQYCGGIEEDTDQDGTPLIRGYLPGDDENDHILQDIKTELVRLEGVNSLSPDTLVRKLRTRTFQEINWADNWKQFYKPVRIGRHFVVYPSWEQPGGLEEDDLSIVLDPGQAFGTGHHESTRLCLALLEDLPLKNWRIADVGCGSGILSIGATRLGAREVWACDPDQIAVDATRRNAAFNNVETQITTILGSVEAIKANGPFDLILANILADVLESISNALRAAAKSGGYLIWSGIMEHQLPWMQTVCDRRSLQVVRIVRENTWVAMLIRRTP